MNILRERVLAVAFSILIVTAPISSASPELQSESNAVGDRTLSDEIEFTNVENTKYARSNEPDSARETYSVSKGTLLEDTKRLLKTTRFVYENGMAITGGVQRGHTAYVKSGSSRQAIKMALYEIAKDKLKPVPTKPEGFVQEASMKGIAAFEAKIQEV